MLPIHILKIDLTVRLKSILQILRYYTACFEELKYIQEHKQPCKVQSYSSESNIIFHMLSKIEKSYDCDIERGTLKQKFKMVLYYLIPFIEDINKTEKVI